MLEIISRCRALRDIIQVALHPSLTETAADKDYHPQCSYQGLLPPQDHNIETCINHHHSTDFITWYLVFGDPL